MRVVVAMGLLTVVAALAPVNMVRYDLTDHQVWALSSALVLAGRLLLIAVNARTPEWKQGCATVPGTVRWTPGQVVRTAADALYMIASFVTPSSSCWAWAERRVGVVEVWPERDPDVWGLSDHYPLVTRFDL